MYYWARLRLVPMAPTLVFAEYETARPPRSLPGDGACGARGLGHPARPHERVALGLERAAASVWTCGGYKRQSQRARLSRLDSAQRSSWLAMVGRVRPSNRTEVRIQLAPPSSPVRTIAISSRIRRPTLSLCAHAAKPTLSATPGRDVGEPRTPTATRGARGGQACDHREMTVWLLAYRHAGSGNSFRRSP